MTTDQRLASLERKCRALTFALVAVTIFAACATLPPLRAQVENYFGWTIDAHGRGTFGADTHLTGASIDVVGLPHDSGGVSILSQSDADEAFLLQGYVRPDGSALKTMSISTHWARQQTTPPGIGGDPILLTRFNTVFMGDEHRGSSDQIWGLACGGYGFVFYPDNPLNAAECPPVPGTVNFNGDVHALKNLVVTGRLIVNGVEIH